MPLPPELLRMDVGAGLRPSWLAWSPDGKRVAYGFKGSSSVKVFDAQTRDRLSWFICSDITGHGSWSPDGTRLVVTEPERLSVWNWRSERRLLQKPLTDVRFAHWHPEEDKLATATGMRLEILDGKTLDTLTTHDIDHPITDAAWLRRSSVVIAHHFGARVIDSLFPNLSVPSATVLAVAASPSGYAVGVDHTVVVNEPELRALEYHGSNIQAVTFSHDGALLAALDKQGMVAIWQAPNWDLIYSWQTTGTHQYALAFSPRDRTLACALDNSIVFYDLSKLPGASARSSVLYLTAKIALVGDSGVGKTGLGWVLTHDMFREHPSSHGEQFWLAERLSTTRADGTQCEAVVWDLAGQPDYRLIHSLFIDDADVALVVFDPTNRQEPLKGAEFWLRALGAPKKRKCKTLLVGARIDRGSGILTSDEVAAFAEAHRVEGGYIATSAFTGEGVPELIARIGELVEWNARVATVTLQTFKDIKDHILAIKEGTPADVLVTLYELQGLLHARTGIQYSVDDIAMATKHLADHGYVRYLRSSSGEHFVLLVPDLLNNVAASMVLEARRNPRGLGALDERRILSGDYKFQELASLVPRDREILLDAATTLFIEHNICFRETLGSDTYLIFPSLINQNKNVVEDLHIVDGTAYTATGATENVYASLVVLLGYTNTFTRTDQWRHHAQYEMGKGQVTGFRLAEEREGQIDLVLYYGAAATSSTRQLFQALFEKFLLARDVEVQIFPPVECSKCRYPQPRSEVMKRQRDHANVMFCSNCGNRVALPERIVTAPTRTAPAEVVDRAQDTAAMRTQFEKAVTWLKSYLRDTNAANAPSCFISYAWGDTQERWVERNLATDLRNAGIEVILDRWHNKPGASITRFIEQIESVDFVLVVGTPSLRKKYESTTTDPVLAAELKLINTRLRKRSDSEGVIPLLREEEKVKSGGRKGRPPIPTEKEDVFPPLLKDSVFLDFRDDVLYFERMFDLLLTLYSIPFEEPAMRDLRDTIRAVAERRRRQ